MYFIIRDNRQAGPYSISSLLNEGVEPDTLVWCEGLAGWTPAAQVPELSMLFGGAPQNPNPGTRYPEAGAYDAPKAPYGSPYSQPPQTPPYGGSYQQYGNPYPAPQHSNWMPWAIVVTICGFLFSCIGGIFGIIGIVQANKANSAFAVGNEMEGRSANSTAKSMVIIGGVLAGLGILATGSILKNLPNMVNYFSM